MGECRPPFIRYLGAYDWAYRSLTQFSFRFRSICVASNGMTRRRAPWPALHLTTLNYSGEAAAALDKFQPQLDYASS